MLVDLVSRPKVLTFWGLRGKVYPLLGTSMGVIPLAAMMFWSLVAEGLVGS